MMKTLTKLRSSAPIWIGAVLIIAGIAISAIAHPHNRGPAQRKRTAWELPQQRPPLVERGPGRPRGHRPRQVSPMDPRVRHFLFPPPPRNRPAAGFPNRRPPLPPPGPLPSPFLSALDQNDDGFIGPEEIAGAAEALKTMDLNDDGKIGPAEWQARGRRLAVAKKNPRTQGRDRGNKAERASDIEAHKQEKKE